MGLKELQHLQPALKSLDRLRSRHAPHPPPAKCIRILAFRYAEFQIPLCGTLPSAMRNDSFFVDALGAEVHSDECNDILHAHLRANKGE
jgi:hypothetical protein